MQTPAIQLLETALVLQKRNMTLKRLLYRHENSLCRESRHKVYGLLALASDCQDGTLQPDYDKDISRIWRDTLGLEMTGHFYGQQISADLVRYSHFLQRFLKIWHLGPESLLTSMPRDPFCILGYSIGRLQAIDVEHQTIMHHSFRTTQMFDSESLIQKGLEPPQTNLFGDLLDPTKAPKGIRMAGLYLEVLWHIQRQWSTPDDIDGYFKSGDPINHDFQASKWPDSGSAGRSTQRR